MATKSRRRQGRLLALLHRRRHRKRPQHPLRKGCAAIEVTSKIKKLLPRRAVTRSRAVDRLHPITRRHSRKYLAHLLEYSGCERLPAIFRVGQREHVQLIPSQLQEPAHWRAEPR